MRVLLMQWDDKTSVNTPYLRNGLMNTHDEARCTPYNHKRNPKP